MSRKEKPSFEVELPPPIKLAPPAPSADRLAVLLGGGAQPAIAAPASAPPVVEPPALEQAPAPVSSLAQERKSAQAQERKGARTHERKRDGAQHRRLHVRLPVDLERLLKRYCVDNERPAGDVVIDALRAYLRA